MSSRSATQTAFTPGADDLKLAHFGSRLIAMGGRRSTRVGALMFILLFVAYHFTAFQLSKVWPLAPTHDMGIIYRASMGALAHGVYPNEIFPYAPSALLLFGVLTLGGPVAFVLVWYGLMLAGLATSLRGGLAGESFAFRAAWPILGVIALAVGGGAIASDLRNPNCNIIYLGLAMGGYALLGRWPRFAGVLIGMSVSMKLYSGLLPVWLLLNGHKRAFIGALVATVFLWVVAPAAIFGVDGLERLYAGWREQLRMVSDPAIHTMYFEMSGGPGIVTLQRAIVAATGGHFGSPETLAWLYALWIVWIATLAWYAWRWRNAFPVAAPSRGALADWVVMLLAPLPFSPWLEPYHMVPILIGALFCSLVALDVRVARTERVAALGALAIVLVFRIIYVPFPVRGFGLFAQLTALVLAIGFIRPSLAPARRSPIEA